MIVARVFVFAVLLVHTVFFLASGMILLTKRAPQGPAALMLGLLSLVGAVLAPLL